MESHPSPDLPSAPDPLVDAVRRVARGDEEALRTLYDALAPRVLGIAEQILRDVGSAEDVVVEVFSQVWRQAERHDARKGSVATWVATMARTRAIDVRRRDQRRVRQEIALSDEARSARVEGGDAPLAAACAADHASIVRRALDRLPRDQRSALEAAYFRGLSHTEIAAALGAPLGTVKTRIRAGLAALRLALGSVEGSTA